MEKVFFIVFWLIRKPAIGALPNRAYDNSGMEGPPIEKNSQDLTLPHLSPVTGIYPVVSSVASAKAKSFTRIGQRRKSILYHCSSVNVASRIL